MRAISLILVLALTGCGAAGTVARGFGDAATAPFEDLNLRRDYIPTVLLQAEANPYDNRNLNHCSTIGAEIARLNEALGRDLDEPPPPDGSRWNEQAEDALAEAALDAIRDATTDFIPGRDWVRRLTGAEQHSDHVQKAIEAGRLRRSYLKGLGMSRNCAPPSAPSWFRPR